MPSTITTEERAAISSIHAALLPIIKHLQDIAYISVTDSDSIARSQARGKDRCGSVEAFRT
jgi:hypothetical protein